MKIFKINFSAPKKIKNIVDNVANELWRHSLRIGDSHYLLSEFEFYIKSTKELSIWDDPFTHSHELQLQTGKLYVHASGVDITWGNNELYVGILIRGVVRFDPNEVKNHVYMDDKVIKKIIHGPHRVATELISNFQFNQFNNLEFSSLNLPDKTQHTFIKTSKTKRFGLNLLDEKHRTFHEMPLRYIGWVPYVISSKHEKGQKTIASKLSIIENNPDWKAEDYKNILGYIPKSI